MRVGGSSRNNGINFYGDTFKVSVTVKKNDDIIIKEEKQPIRGKLDELIGDIPVIRTIAFLLKPPMLFLLIIVVLSDFFLSPTHSLITIDEAITRIIVIILLVFTLICVFVIAKTTIWKIKMVWKFHGAEHKTIYAAKNDVPLELYHVRECPRETERCGTNIITFLIPLTVLFQITAYFVNIVDYSIFKFILPFALSYELFNIDDGDKKPVLKHFYQVSFWLQKYVLTKEPDDIQLQAAILAMQRLVDLERAENKES